MFDTYKARLKGNRVEWTDDHPVTADQDREVEVLITLLYEAQTPAELPAQRGERMAQCLEKIAQTGGIQGIADPVAWQRDIRQDRLIYPENHHAA